MSTCTYICTCASTQMSAHTHVYAHMCMNRHRHKQNFFKKRVRVSCPEKHTIWTICWGADRTSRYKFTVVSSCPTMCFISIPGRNETRSCDISLRSTIPSRTTPCYCLPSSYSPTPLKRSTKTKGQEIWALPINCQRMDCEL